MDGIVVGVPLDSRPDEGLASRAASLFARPEKRRSALTLTGGRGGPGYSTSHFHAAIAGSYGTTTTGAENRP